MGAHILVEFRVARESKGLENLLIDHISKRLSFIELYQTASDC